MKENTVYLLYNTNASDVKLHHGLVANFNRENGGREWEYEDKDEFTIMYSPDDERKYTDIKILSKTKLKERPKSADQVMKNVKVSVEGILIRRSNSLSIIEEDLVVLRRCPQIKPLLSETEIHHLQLLLQECRKNKPMKVETESSISNGFYQLFPDDKNFRKPIGDLKGVRLYESAQDKRILSAHRQELDGNKTREKAKMSSRDDNIVKKDKKGFNASPPVNMNKVKNKAKMLSQNDKTGKTKSLDRWMKTPNLITKKIEKGDGKNNLFGVTEEVKPKKQEFIGTRPKSDDTSKKDKRKNKQSNGENKTSASLNKERLSETPSQVTQNISKKKGSKSYEDEQKETKQIPSKNDSVKKKKEIDRTTKTKESLQSKESLSDQVKFNHPSEKTQLSKKQELKKKNSDNFTSSNNKTKDKDNGKTPSVEKTEKSKKSGKTKPANDSDKISKDEKSPRSSIPFSSKQILKKGKKDLKVKNKTEDGEALAEDLLKKNENAKSTQSKSSPSEKSKITNKTVDPGDENTSAKKGKTKDKLPGTIQYIIHYILSNPIFINLGWTLPATKKAFSRIVTFKALPANPLSYCFRNRDKAEQKLYPSGALALNVAEDGTGRINYPNGAPAIIMASSPTGMKLTLFSCPTKDPLVKESFYTRIIGMFDSFGNGVVYNSNGKKILNFNQMEGIYYSPSKQTPYKWQWSCFKLLEAKQLKELLNAMVNEVKQPPTPTTKGGKVVKAPSSGSSRKSVTSQEKKPVDTMYDALLEELPYPVMPKSKIKMKTHDNACKSIILKINKEITLRISGQDSVNVNFSAKSLFYKMDLGVKIDPENVERVDEVADNRVESILSVLGDLLHPSPSLQKLHKLLDPNAIH